MSLQRETKYTASATATGGREGTVRTMDGSLDLQLRFPEEMGGQGGGSNPELLFAAGFAGCFRGALGRAGRVARVDTSHATVTVHVGIGPEGESFGLDVTIEVGVPGESESVILELAERAHELCAYSKATRGNIPVVLRAVTAS